ncbi:hypothetical protein HW555_013698 [Spodoptera exigua]|uniref:Uncharacterized protein n=1 Tax=Spodoptera exigua TaxID=7107 RepID=A0A835G159_SPOEX|nr:hypothetical protein HW555_013698 [Spodoptera exigua]
MNDFCPYFIGNPIREPLSQLSIFSGYSTPQANTPLSYDFEDASTPTSITKRVRRDKGNVRRKLEQEWKDTKRKTLLNRGKKYVTRKGILKQKKTIKSPCKCRMKCFDKISNSQRHRLLKDFWGLGDHHRQWSFVSNLVTRNPKRRIFTDKPDSRRKYTIKYRLPVPNVDENQSVTYVNVCKTQFLATFSISEQFVYTAIEKTEKATGIIECDGRGKHDKHPRKITDVIKQSVCDHIKSLQPVEAHYVRKDSARLYLDGDLNFHKLFSLYNEWIDPEIYNDKAKTKRQYKTVVNDNFKLSFFKPKKDRCDIGNNVQWRKIRELKVLPDNPYQIHYKYNLSESEYMTISTTSNTRRRRQVDTIILRPIYNNPIPIPKAKRDDLISLCDSGIIPSSHHDFYRNLTFIDSTRALPTSDTESE